MFKEVVIKLPPICKTCGQPPLSIDVYCLGNLNQCEMCQDCRAILRRPVLKVLWIKKAKRLPYKGEKPLKQ